MILDLLGCLLGHLLSFLIYPVAALIVYKIYQALWAIPRIDRHPSKCFILVTGCGRGFGREIVKRLDNLGCHVFAGCRSELGMKELKAETSERCHVFKMDVTKTEDIQATLELVKSVIPRGQGLWGVVCNAGIAGSRVGPPEWTDEADFHECFDVNLYGYIRVVRAFLPLVKSCEGRILLVSSLYGRLAYPVASPYAASKFATEAYGDGLRRSLRPYNCKVILIEPGVHLTNITKEYNLIPALRKGWESLSQEEREELGEEYFKKYSDFLLKPFRTDFWNDPAEVAVSTEAALFCKYPKARYVVGNDAHYVFVPVTYLPEWLIDWLISVTGGQPTPPTVLRKR